MPQSPAIIERQLAEAKADLATIEANVSGMEPKKHPKWREANGRCKQLESRLAAHQEQRGGGASSEE